MPIRTCVGCHQREQQHNLTRWVAEQSGRIKIDSYGRQPGRGAYVHRARSCLAAAAKSGFAKSLRRKTQYLDVERLWDLVEDKESTA